MGEGGEATGGGGGGGEEVVGDWQVQFLLERVWFSCLQQQIGCSLESTMRLERLFRSFCVCVRQLQMYSEDLNLVLFCC